jgi:hypothetical protein
MCLANLKRNQLYLINTCSGNGYMAVGTALNRGVCVPTGFSAGLGGPQYIVAMALQTA